MRMRSMPLHGSQVHASYDDDLVATHGGHTPKLRHAALVYSVYL